MKHRPTLQGLPPAAISPAFERWMNDYRSKAEEAVTARAARLAEGEGSPKVIMIYGPIISSLEQEIYSRWFGLSDDVLVSGKVVLDKLAKIEGDVEVRLNSPGGDVWEASAIINALILRAEAGDKVTVHVDGLAASAASLIMLTGDPVTASPLANVMIHQASGIVYGNADEMRSYARFLDKVDLTGAKLYAARSEMSQTEALQAMQKETWYTADEALEAGFVDEVRQLRKPKKNQDADAGGSGEGGADDLDEGTVEALTQRRTSGFARVAGLAISR